MSSNLAGMVPSFSERISGGKSTQQNMTIEFASKGGLMYTQFAKSKAWGKDLYEDLVAPGLNHSLNVETWRLGSGGRMGSFCENTDDDFWTVHPTAYNIIEVSEVEMPDGAAWLGTQDHSKWVRHLRVL
ncbi:unnamed protein product [Symbiodinium microadriaticum]|nr:unnamed protein product [Symbiodinium microadriaticum]